MIAADETDVMNTLYAYADFYCAKDTKGLMSLFDEGDDISLIGTGADETCSGRAAVQAVFDRNFVEATAHKFEWGWRHMIVTDASAVVAVSLTIFLTAGGKEIRVPIRWTISLIRRPSGWKWLHRHASTPANSQKEGNAYPEGKAG